MELCALSKEAQVSLILNKINDLTHHTESILDKVKNELLAPTPNTIQSINHALTLLNKMVKEPSDIENIDISDCLNSLENELSRCPQENNNSDSNKSIPFLNKAGKEVFSLEKSSLERSENMGKGGSNVYLLEFDLENDIEKKGKTAIDIMNSLIQLCYFLDCKLDSPNSTSSKNIERNKSTFYVLVSTVLEQDMAYEFLGLEKEKIGCYDIDGNLIENEDDETIDLLDLSELDAISQELSDAECLIDKSESSDQGQDFPAIKVTSGDEEISVAVRDSHEEKARGFINKTESARKTKT